MPKRSIALRLMSKVRLILARIWLLLRGNKSAAEKKQSFYELSESCQIPDWRIYMKCTLALKQMVVLLK